MANSVLLQVRTSAEDKERASEILESLGTNLSAVVNMMIKQIIITEGIPFEVKMRPTVYSRTEAVKEVQATMAFEGLDLTEEEIKMLKPEEQMKYEIAMELGLFDKVQIVGWKGLSSRETGKIGGLLATRKKQKHVDT